MKPDDRQSLKSEMAALATLLLTTPSALYERQREIYRAGLVAGNGKGPGRGVRVSTEAVALLVLAHVAKLSPERLGNLVSTALRRDDEKAGSK